MDVDFNSDPVRTAKCALYQADRALARKHQGSDTAISTTLDKLHDYIAHYGHPYDLYTDHCIDIVSKIDQDDSLGMYHESASGHRAELMSPDGYLYRLTTHNKIFRKRLQGRKNFPGQWNLNAPALEGKGLDGDFDQVYQHLLKKSSAAPAAWLRLADYATGAVASPRHHSFWSDYEHACGIDSFQSRLANLARHASRIGMPSDQIVEQMHVLRCKKADAVALIHVPNAVDAFDYTVFYPMTLASLPRTGKAINLAEIRRYATGDGAQRAGRIRNAIAERRTRILVANEYTLRPVPVEYIEILPVKYTLSRDPGLLQENLYGALKDLYAVWCTVP